MEPINNILSNELLNRPKIKNRALLPNQKCPYCGENYKWLNEFTDIAVPNCECEKKIAEEEAKQNQERERLIKLQREQEKLKLELENRIRESRITPKMKDFTFDTLSENKEILKQLEIYANEFQPKNSKGLCLIGNVGTGKTASLSAIVNRLLENGFKCLILTFQELLNLHKNYSQDHYSETGGFLNWLKSFDFIVLDEISRWKYTDSNKDIAFSIINTLLNEKVVTAFTANPDSLGILSKEKDLEPTIDRLREMCPVTYQFRGSSLRGKGV